MLIFADLQPLNWITDKLKSEQIENQKKLIEFQQDQISGVLKTVKSEMKSCVDIVEKNNSQSKQIITKSVKEAVCSVNEEEKISRNLMRIKQVIENKTSNIISVHLYKIMI